MHCKMVILNMLPRLLTRYFLSIQMNQIACKYWAMFVLNKLCISDALEYYRKGLSANPNHVHLLNVSGWAA